MIDTTNRAGRIFRGYAVGRTSRSAALLAALVLGACDGPATLAPLDGEPIDLAAPWETAEPAEVGIRSGTLLTVGMRARDIAPLRSLVVVRHGRLALERYYAGTDAGTLADVRSITKTVVSTLVGIALEQGYITSLDQPITEFLSPDEFELRDVHQQITVRHLLTMAGGFQWSEAAGAGYGVWWLAGDHVNSVLALPLSSAPGTEFVYNSPAVHLLGVVLAKAVGRPLPSFADEVLFGPLGVDAVAWEDLSSGYVNGGAGIDLRPRDLARLGQLFMQGGRSGTAQLVPASWVDASTHAQWSRLGSVGPISDVSYGFLWWVDQAHDAYFAWGFGGQFIYVVPDLEVVVVATTDWGSILGDVTEVQNAVLELIVDGIVAGLD